jgi:Septum formation
MRRYLVIGVVVLLLAAACAPQVRGRFVVPSASPLTGRTPRVGQCYGTNPRDTQGPAHIVEGPCVEPHYLETAYVGQLTGAAAKLAVAPPAGAAELADADQQCAIEAAKYLGGPLIEQGMMYLVVMPVAWDWVAGARWFSCDLIPLNIDANPSFRSRQGSARGIGSGRPDPVCVNLVTDTANPPVTADRVTPTRCDVPHNAEYLGPIQTLFDAPYPEGRTWARYSRLCRDRLATVMGVSEAAVNERWVYEVYGPNLAWWGYGLRAVQCYFVLLKGRTVNRSIRGSQGAGIPDSQ